MPRKYVRKTESTGTDAPEGVAKVASLAGTSRDDVKALLAQIEDLKGKLELEQRARGEAEQAALELAEAQGNGLAQQTTIQEIPTGKKIKVQKLEAYETVSYKDDGRPILKPKFRSEDVPTFFYKIDLPPVGGLGLVLNGMPLYHGTVYEFDLDALRTVKDMVFKCWKHDADIHGTDENVYRKPQNKQISMKSGAISTYRG
jgi:hypothetical protein